MKNRRKNFSAEFKAKIAVEAIKVQRTIQELASQYGVHPQQITKWKRQALEELPEVFRDRRGRAARAEEELKSKLYEEIGQLKVELDWLKKKSGLIC